MLPSPPDSSHLPEPELANLMRTPRLGVTFSRRAILAVVFNSLSFSMTMMILRPIFWASKANSMNSSSL